MFYDMIFTSQGLLSKLDGRTEEHQWLSKNLKHSIDMYHQHFPADQNYKSVIPVNGNIIHIIDMMNAFNLVLFGKERGKKMKL